MEQDCKNTKKYFNFHVLVLKGEKERPKWIADKFKVISNELYLTSNWAISKTSNLNSSRQLGTWTTTITWNIPVLFNATAFSYNVFLNFAINKIRKGRRLWGLAADFMMFLKVTITIFKYGWIT